MHKKSRITLWAILAIFVGAMVIMPFQNTVQADELKDKQSQLQAIQKQINAQRSIVSSTKKKEKGIVQEIARLEKEMNVTQSEIDKLESQVEVVGDRIDVTQEYITKTEKHLSERVDALDERLVTIYEVGDVSYLEVLISASDFGDFLTRWELLNRIVEQDQHLIKTISAERAELHQKKQQLEEDQRRLNLAEENKRDKEALLKQKAGQKAVALKDVQKERKALEQGLRELEANSKQIEKIIQSMQKNTGAYQGTGIFTWPAPSSRRITSQYGMRYHPILKVNKLHTGVDIGASSGSSVVSADGGRVIYTGYLGGYGNTIVIDHGGGISTLYGHLSKFNTAVGTKTSKGDLIGKVGSTGWSTGPHLHFEVRKNGTPVNPNSYL